jgi:hypothetical protein
VKPTRVGIFIQYVESLSDDTEGNEVVKCLQTISRRVLNWVVGVFEDNSGEFLILKS